MIKKVFTFILLVSTLSLAQLVAPKISIQQGEFNFGDIQEGTIASHSFIITNTGGDLLKIKDVRPSCGCTAAAPDKKELAPGESTKIKVEFNSDGRMGQQEKTISIITNDPKTPQAILKFYGNVIKKVVEDAPRLKFSEMEHNFGKVEEGQVVDYTFKFKNVGKKPLVIGNVKTSCGCTAALVSSKNVAPGNEGTIRVELDTKNRAGKMSRNVTIESNDPSAPSMILTIFAEVQPVKS
ncbi:MAG TPA: DUF1573 domain-containing protein [Ignavibacteriaceae bacterium]|nr:DUF1573 domain-containing protein [Ignavibacteriaceae bacterium]